jgi:hypothetical protein
MEAVPTFESIGVYISVESEPQEVTAVLDWRLEGTKEWRSALAPVAYPPDHQFRGSILLVEPDKAYEIRARLSGKGVPPVESVTAVRTWRERVPIAREIVLPPGVTDRPLVISESGTPDGWILYRADPAGSTIDVGAGSPSALSIEHAAYVLVDGLVLRGGDAHGIHVVDSHDVRIRHCDIAGWGEPGTWRYHAGKKQWAYLDAKGNIIDRQAGVRIHGAASQRVVVEGNLIHHPRGTSASWAFAHPHGPSGMVLSETGGNNVIRNNDVFAGAGHRWNDAIESEYNGQVNGGPYRDTDIEGNLLVGANDDGTELDGGQMNVRYWHNWIEGGFCGVSCAPNIRGPSYVFRNVIVTGDERGASGAGFKMGGDQIPNPGVSFLLQNTVYTNNYGLTSGHYGKGPTPIVSRHNLFAGPAGGHGRLRLDQAVSGDLDADVVPAAGLLGSNLEGPGRERNAVFGTPRFRGVAERDFRLEPGSLGSAGIQEPLANLGGERFGAWQANDGSGAWPPRAGAPDVLPLRSMVRVRQGGVAHFTLKVLASEPWTAQAGENWLDCTRERDASALQCRVDGAVLPVGTFSTFVSVRLNSGIRRTVPVVVEVEPAKPVTTHFEPEHATLPTGFLAMAAADASEGGFVEVDAVNRDSAIGFTFDVQSTDVFFVLARVRAKGPVAKLATQDSIMLQLDDGSPMKWDMFGVGTDVWTWVVARPVERVDGRFPLSAGPHRLTIAGNEAGLQLDELLVSNSPFADETPPQGK